jgi:hypothetical protein
MNAQYISDTVIRVERDGQVLFVPTDPANADYQAIMALVEAGELVIAPPEGEP